MFMARLLSGVVLVVIAAVTLLTGGYLLAAVCLFISMAAYGELVKACKIRAQGQGLNALESVGYLGIVCYYAVVVFTESAQAQLFAILFTMAAFMFVYVFAFPKYRAEQVMGAFSVLHTRR